MTKPDSFDGYDEAASQRAIRSCRYIAHHLGDLKQELILMGGMVPTVLVDSTTLPHGVDAHVGTMDVDLGLVLAHQTLDKLERTKARLKEIGFAAHLSETARMRREDADGNVVVVDLLCGGETPTDEPSLVVPRIADHVELAFLDSMDVQINGPSTDGTEVATSMNVCGPGAFVLAKASTFAHRRENKDAYDLFFVLQYFGSGPASVFTHLAPLLQTDAGKRA
ncbi:MAG: hypothetical protein KDA60_07900, partial [Planctomycetales bacterium]|nr:hypothetical protein [Planctomycetales bacterium]